MIKPVDLTGRPRATGYMARFRGFAWGKAVWLPAFAADTLRTKPCVFETAPDFRLGDWTATVWRRDRERPLAKQLADDAPTHVR